MSGSGVQADGVVHYRSDGYGTRVAVFPATCRCGIHQLAVTGYRATEGGGLVTLRCDACATAGDLGGRWLLRTSGDVANSAELDDVPYRASSRA